MVHAWDGRRGVRRVRRVPAVPRRRSFVAHDRVPVRFVLAGATNLGVFKNLDKKLR